MSVPGLNGSAKELGVRFNLVSLLPTTLLVALVLALLQSGAPGHEPDGAKLWAELKAIGAGELVAVSIGLLAVSLILHPFQLALMKLLEGYWEASPAGHAFGMVGIELHRRRRERLQAISERQTPLFDLTWPYVTEQEKTRQVVLADRELSAYPTEARLLPTKLGNALRAGEDEAGSQYSLKAVTMWPRLFPHLSAPQAGVVTDRRNQVDIAIRLCVTLAAATLITVALLFRYGWWLLLPTATALLSVVSYRAAVRAAISYGEALRVAFDLYRFDMIKNLRYELPTNEEDEAALGDAISEFFINGTPVQRAYIHNQPDGASTTGDDAETGAPEGGREA